MSDTPGNDRVEPPAGNDYESMRQHGRQLAIDSLLALVLREPQAGAAPQSRQLHPAPSSRPSALWRHRWVALAAAACIVVATALVAHRLLRHAQDRLVTPPEQLVRHERDDTKPTRGTESVGVPVPQVVLASDWQIEPTGSARYHILAERHVQLDEGELRVTASANSAAPTGDLPLVIETSAGTATATHTNFFIGTHDLEPSIPKGSPMFRKLTRVLVLAGAATLSNSSGSVTGTAGQLLAAEPDKPPVNLAVKANDTFAFDLYQRMAQQGEGRNIVMSPYSISSALTMTAEGARGQTAEQMGKVLGFPAEARRIGADAQLIPWNTALIHTGMAELNDRFNGKGAVTVTDAEVQKEADRLWQDVYSKNVYTVAGQPVNLPMVEGEWKKRCATLADEMRANKRGCDIRVANALWGERTFPFRKEFTDTIAMNYGTGGLIPIDFSNPEAARQIINQWVQTQTKDKIKDVIPENVLDRYTRLVLTNAIYFKSQWASPFNPKLTRDGEFFATPDHPITVKQMSHHLKKCRYVADENVQAIELPYAGGDMGMVIILPTKKDGLPGVEKSLGSQTFAGWVGKLHETDVLVRLPKFRILGASDDLSDTLRMMGMTDAFDGQRANFSGMVGPGNSEPHPFVIAKVLHKALIEVNEEGTVAAAATVVVMPPGAAIHPPQPLQFTADHPFFFAIRDIKTGSVVFMGHVTEPMP